MKCWVNCVERRRHPKVKTEWKLLCGNTVDYKPTQMTNKYFLLDKCFNSRRLTFRIRLGLNITLKDWEIRRPIWRERYYLSSLLKWMRFCNLSRFRKEDEREEIIYGVWIIKTSRNFFKNLSWAKQRINKNSTKINLKI